MVRIVQVKDLEARKRALVAESELYRQTLTLEIQNVRLCAQGWRRRINLVSSVAPFVAAGVPVVSSLFGGRRRSWLGIATRMAFKWGLHKHLGPLVQGFMRSRQTTAAGKAEAEGNGHTRPSQPIPPAQAKAPTPSG